MDFERIKFFVRWIFLAICVYAAAVVSDMLVLPGDFLAPVWLPVGLALAVTLLWGRALWPGILLGLGAFYLWRGAPLTAAAFVATTETIEVLLAAFFTTRWVSPQFQIVSLKDMIRFVVGVLLACGFAGVLLLLGQFDNSPAVILSWWLSQVNGLILITPLVVSWFRPRTTVMTRVTFAEILILWGITLTLGGLVFAGWLPETIAITLPYLTMLLLIWPATRFNQIVTFHTMILLASLALMGTALGKGAFSDLPPQARLLSLQNYLAVIGLLGLILGEVVPERRRQRQILEKSHGELEQRERENFQALEKSRADLLTLVENTDYFIWSVDCDLRVVTFNTNFAHGFEHQFGFCLQKGQDTLSLLPDEISAIWMEWYRRAMSGKRFSVDFPQQLKDGLHYFKINFHPVYHHDGAVTGVVVFARDITETQYLLDELGASEARWRTLLQNAPMMVTMTDMDGKILAINRSFSPEKTIDDFIGDDYYSYLPDENQTQTRQASRSAVETGKLVYFELPLPQENGDPVWMAHRVVPVLQNGRPAALIYLVTEITEQKLVEQTLRASESRLRSTIESAPFGAHSYELEADGRLIFSGYNPAANRILGIDHALMMGKTIEEAFSGLVGTPIPDQYRCVAANGERYDDEQVAYSKDQIDGAFEVHAFQTAPNRMTVFFRDITERKKAENALKQNQAALAKAQQIAHLGSYEIVWATMQVSWSDETFRIWDFSGDEPPNYDWFLAHIHPEDKPRVVAKIEDLRSHGKTFSMDYRILRESGEVRWLHDAAEVVTDDAGNVMKIFGTMLDITERMQAQERVRQMNEELEQRVRLRTAELEASNLELESFTYTISHDLRSPLRAIDGFSHILVDEYIEQLSDDAVHWLKAIRSNAQQMGRLIDDLLAFARLGRQALNRRSVNMEDLVHLALLSLKADLAGRAVTLDISPLPDCSGDPSLLLEVWKNLLSNALKFTRDRLAAQIEIRVVQNTAETIYSVRDNGTGFDMQYADKLFEVFQRLHAAEKYEGTGVGLAVVARIIRKHGGRVWAEGQEDQGATFYFALPS
jgi:PAS domain S-box-containing protein